MPDERPVVQELSQEEVEEMKEEIAQKLSSGLKSSFYFNEARKCKDPEEQLRLYDLHLAEKVIEQRREMLKSSKKIALEDLIGRF